MNYDDKKYYKNSPNNIINNNLTTSILQKHNATEFHCSLPEYKPTPLIQLTNLSEKYKLYEFIYLKVHNTTKGCKNATEYKFPLCFCDRMFGFGLRNR